MKKENNNNNETNDPMSEPLSGSACEPGRPRPRGQQNTIDRWLEAAGDRLNPILVKETRQALKSRQFILWFVLLLIACWITTIGGVALIGPSIYYMSSGSFLLYAYFFILALPLTVVVPFSAYRSLSAEQEENTRDLLEVSTLTPQQLINGKLGSAALQGAIYLSALAPCLAFTYLLRGVDVMTISLLLSYAVLTSIGLSLIGLLLATSTQHRHGQVMVSVLMAAGLFGALSTLMTAATGVIQLDASERQEEWFGYLHLLLLSFYLTTLGIVYCAACGLSTFASANRSTPLRIALVVQQTVCVAWIAGVWVKEELGNNDFLVVAFSVAMVYWMVAGAVMSGEQPVLSQRIRRSLPQSFLGRVFLSWFSPGPGSGYVFAIANLGLLGGLGCLAILTSNSTRGSADMTAVSAIVLLWCYTVAYLGLGRFVITLLRKFAPLSLFGCFLVQLLLVLGGCGLPFLLQTIHSRMRLLNISLVQVPSPVWSIGRLMQGGMSAPQELTLMVSVVAVAVVALLLNLVLAGHEARRLRLAKPQRLVEDDRLNSPAIVRPTNPWGDTQEQV